MTFIWPNLLWSLLLLPLLVAAYLWLLRKRRRSPVRLASLAVAKAALGKGPGWRRHVPPLLLLLAIGTLLFAMARPLAVITLPLSQRTIILAMDVSGSMRATDVQPSRIVAAQEAAKAFVNGLPREVRVGVVAFAGTAAVVQAPTASREDVIAAIDRFQLQRATATGSGIILSLATIFPDAGIEISQATGQRNMPASDRREEGARRSSRRCAPGLLHLGRDHHADRRRAHHRARPAGSRQDGRRPRRARLHRGHRHRRRRDHRLRGLEHARAPGRGGAEAGGAADPGRVLLRRHAHRT